MGTQQLPQCLPPCQVPVKQDVWYLTSEIQYLTVQKTPEGPIQIPKLPIGTLCDLVQVNEIPGSSSLTTKTRIVRASSGKKKFTALGPWLRMH